MVLVRAVNNFLSASWKGSPKLMNVEYIYF